MASIHIIPVHILDRKILTPLSKEISHQFGLQTSIYNIEFDVSFAYDPFRNQYHSTKLISGIRNLIDSPSNKYLAVTELDLFIPILTYVFGEAQLNGPVSIVSTKRLQPEFYGLPWDENVALDRLKKEAVHELGHTFGLHHCPDFQCVLHSSTYVEEIDFKLVTLCENCLLTLKKNMLL
ncbi:archaemetzincin family Zn-dependent metalloprotease [candidate division KSB1 bacterium]|nr:archaemetzincin family Zn-dependent metalloprotease [candidate division KSB1 bacterium]